MSASANFAYAGSFAAVALALMGLLRGRRSLGQWLFAAGMAVIALEQGLQGFACTRTSPEAAMRPQVWRLIVLSMMPAVWIIFSQTYARGGALTFLNKRRPKLVAALVLPTLAAFILSNQMISRALWDPINSQWVMRLGWAGLVVHGSLLIGSILVVMNLERTYRSAVGTMRWRVKFMLLGVGVLFVVRVYTSSQALLFRGLDPVVEALNSGALLAAALLITRSFFRSGQFDVDVYPSQSILQGSITVFVAGVYLVVVGSLAKVASLLGGDNAFALKAFLTLVLLVVLAVVLQSDRARLQLSRFVSRNFQRPLYDYRTVWVKFTEETMPLVAQSDVCRALVRLIADMFATLSVAIWVLDEKNESLGSAASTFLKNSGPRVQNLNAVDTEMVMRRFESNADSIDFESLDAPWASVLRSIHPSEFPNGGHRVVVPLVAQGNFIGLIMIGDRVGGAKFTMQDFDMLKCIGAHASASLRNTILSKQLLQAKELEAFQTMAAFFVHDLKNAASTLNLMLQNMPDHLDDPAFRGDALRGMAKTAAHIERLIARISTIRHEQKLNLSEFDFNELVSEVVAGLERGPNAVIYKNLESLPKVILDREQILKVVTNLVLNAVEAVQSNGHVTLGTCMSGTFVVLTVTDDGCGMNAEFLSNGLFRPFKTTKKNGLGIGMFQSKMIVEAHGGRISVASALHKGTTFNVFLPNGRITK